MSTMSLEALLDQFIIRSSLKETITFRTNHFRLNTQRKSLLFPLVLYRNIWSAHQVIVSLFG